MAKEQRTAKYFNSLSPTGVRTVKSFASRWGEMQAAYKYLLDIQIFNVYRHISNFNAGLVRGSTGRESWWVLSKREQRENIGKRGVLQAARNSNCRYCFLELCSTL